MKRFSVEVGGDAMPAIDLADDAIAIGSGPVARIRLPAQVAREVHVRIERDRWLAHDAVIVDGAPRAAGDRGELGHATTFEFGGYRVCVTSAPVDSPPASAQRTESLARELLRGLLGAGAQPGFEHEGHGSRLSLPPPEATLVIGRGDEAGWVILDEDLSREHAEVRRSWDGVTVRDLGSKNGTRVDGARIVGAVELHDGARIELGNVVLVFRDPAERHLRGESTAPAPRRASIAPVVVVTRGNPIVVVVAGLIAALAAVGLAWVLVS